jgi:hypothetical protein
MRTFSSIVIFIVGFVAVVSFAQCWQPNRNRHRNLGFFEKPNLTATEIFVTAT